MDGVGGDVEVNVSSEKTATVEVVISDSNNNTIYSSGTVRVRGTETFTYTGPRNEDGTHFMREGQMTVRVLNFSKRATITVNGHRVVRTIYESMMAQR